MLLSCDAIMEQRGFRQIANLSPVSWAGTTWRLSPTGNVTDGWLPYFLARQYHKPGDTADVVSVAGVLWDRNNDDFVTPVALASRMRTTDPASKDLVWLCIHQIWEKDAGPDGTVRVLGRDLSRYTEKGYQQAFSRLEGGKILSVACPLLEIVDVECLTRCLLDPLLNHPWPPQAGTGAE